MKSNRKIAMLGTLALGALMAGINATPARAQVLEGKFTLPSTTHWGVATLPPGNYSFTLASVNLSDIITVSREGRAVALITAQGFGYTASGRSEMVLINGTVRELCLPQIGSTFKYGAGKPHVSPAQQERELAQIIPLTAKAAGQ